MPQRRYIVELFKPCYLYFQKRKVKISKREVWRDVENNLQWWSKNISYFYNNNETDLSMDNEWNHHVNMQQCFYFLFLPFKSHRQKVKAAEHWAPQGLV